MRRRGATGVVLLVTAFGCSEPAGPERSDLAVGIGPRDFKVVIADTLRVATAVIGDDPARPATVTLASSDPLVAEIRPDGLLQARSIGTAWIYVEARRGSALARDSTTVEVVHAFVTDSSAYVLEFETRSWPDGHLYRFAEIDILVRYANPLSTPVFVRSYCGSDHYLWGDELEKRTADGWAQAVDVGGGGLCVFPTRIEVGETVRYRARVTPHDEESQLRLFHPVGGEYRIVLDAYRSWSVDDRHGARLPAEMRTTTSFTLSATGLQ